MYSGEQTFASCNQPRQLCKPKIASCTADPVT